jgi:nicotinate-nucleotide adenylyltransferase
MEASTGVERMPPARYHEHARRGICAYMYVNTLTRLGKVRQRYRFQIMRLGLLGGSFNPVHYGHLLLAETAREDCRLDQVWFVPAAVPPHKQSRSLAEGKHRVEMLKLAIGGHPQLDVATIELDRGGVSYTVETLTALTSPNRELFLILGSDALLDLPNWRQPERICELATLIVARRPGAGPVSLDCLAAVVPEERRRHFARHQIEMPRLDLSSSDIRRRVAAGRSIRYRTPRGVEEYIRAQGLYAAPDEPEATRLDPRRSCGG